MLDAKCPLGRAGRAGRWLVALLSLCATLTLRAEPVDELYTVETLVASQSAGERGEAARRALEELLVRISGNTEAPDSRELRDALSRAGDFIYEFNYAATDRVIERDGREQPATRLVLRFAPTEVERLLRSAGLAFWPASRPDTLVWLVSRTGDGTARVEDTEVLRALVERARYRGLPLIQPLDDLEDRLALPADKLWELDEKVIQKASQRYNASAVLVGRFSETSDGRWRSDWQLLHEQGSPTFYVDADSRQALMRRAVDRVADHFAERYAIVPGADGPDSVVLALEAVENFADYKQAQDYLESLPAVRGVALVSAESQRLELRLSIDGEQTRLLSALEQDGRLQPVSRGERISLIEDRSEPAGSRGNPLKYRWSGGGED